MTDAERSIPMGGSGAGEGAEAPPNLTVIAREILIASKWPHELAAADLRDRIVTDDALLREAIDYAVSNILREVTSSQRRTFHDLVSKATGVDNVRGLAVIAKESFLDTYQLLNHLPIGDARKADCEAYLSHHAARAHSATVRVRFMRAILKSPKFKDGKRVRECFTDLEIARLAGELKC